MFQTKFGSQDMTKMVVQKSLSLSFILFSSSLDWMGPGEESALHFLMIQMLASPRNTVTGTE